VYIWLACLYKILVYVALKNTVNFLKSVIIVLEEMRVKFDEFEKIDSE